jgi:hypothetical protein
MTKQFIHGYALLVGVGQTVDPAWSLPVTVQDAQALQGLLTDAKLCGYAPDHVRLLQDQGAARQAILEGLDWLKQKATADPEATVVFFYSGHGLFDLAEQAYYLLPHDFDQKTVAATALFAQTLSKKLREIPAQRLWVIIDSCHAEGMAQTKGRLPVDCLSTAVPKGMVESLKQGEGRAIFTSSRGNQSSWVRPDGTLSVYTFHLLEALQGAANQPGDRQVRLSQVMAHLGKTVPKSAKDFYQAQQTPFFDTATEDFPVALLGGGKGIPTGLAQGSDRGANSRAKLPHIPTDQEMLTPALAMAKRSLAILETQAATYTASTIPPHLQLDLEEKRQKVAELQARLGEGNLNA